MDFPGGSDGKEIACNAGDLGLIPRSTSSHWTIAYTLGVSGSRVVLTFAQLTTGSTASWVVFFKIFDHGELETSRHSYQNQ